MTNGSEYTSPEWSPDVRNQNGSELEGLGFNLCVASSRVIVSLILEDRNRVRDDFVVKDKSWTRTTRRKIQVIEQEEDYVKDKSIFKLKKHTGVCATYIVWSLYEKEQRTFQVWKVLWTYKESPVGLDRDSGDLEMSKMEQPGITNGRAGNNK